MTWNHSIFSWRHSPSEVSTTSSPLDPVTTASKFHQVPSPWWFSALPAAEYHDYYYYDVDDVAETADYSKSQSCVDNLTYSWYHLHDNFHANPASLEYRLLLYVHRNPRTSNRRKYHPPSSPTIPLFALSNVIYHRSPNKKSKNTTSNIKLIRTN